MQVIQRIPKWISALSVLTLFGGCSHPAARSLSSTVALTSNTPWPEYASDLGASKFSTAAQIDRFNVKDLRVAWQWDSPDNALVTSLGLDTAYYEATPLMVNDKIYISTSLNQVAALDPETGRTFWSFDPEIYKKGYPPNSGFVHRGVSFWTDGSRKSILLGTGNGYLLSLDADTGKLQPDFGAGGKIDLTQGLRRAVVRSKYAVTSPPVVCRNTVIVGSSIPDFFYKQGMPPGDVRGFDVKSGALKWTFHTIPQAGEIGVSSWKKGSWKNVGNTNVWAPMSADEAMGSVFLPVSTPSNDYYGGERPGNGLFGESLVSLNCETGVRNWHFQLVHHGLWDYDPPAAPILMDITVAGKPIKAVVQVTKQSFAYVFDRTNGVPVWPIHETPVEASTVPGEEASPTQPIPSKPAPFDRQGISEDDLIDFSPELRAQAREILGHYHYGKLFTPPSLTQPTIVLPGVFGGASWAGAAYSPLTGKLYVPSITEAFSIELQHLPFSYYRYTNSILKSSFVAGPQGLPLVKPPYGRITAIDMNSGEQAWMTPVGTGPRKNPALQGVSLPQGDLGWNRRIQVLATPTLLFAAQAGPAKVSGLHFSSVFPNAYKIKVENDDPALRALDLETGEQLAKIPLPGNAFGALMTYIYRGKQYIVLPIGGANLKAGLVALSLGQPN